MQNNTFSENLKRIRKEKKFKQNEVAEIIGVGKSTYCQYENGQREPDVLKIIKLAQVLEVSGDTLLGIEQNEISNIKSKKEISKEEIKQDIINNLNELNELGYQKILERIEELKEVPKYQEKFSLNKTKNVKTTTRKIIVEAADGVIYDTPKEYIQEIKEAN